jgi:hypothetical protein
MTALTVDGANAIEIQLADQRRTSRSQAGLPVWLSTHDGDGAMYLSDAHWAIPILTIAAEISRRRRRRDRRN